MMLLRACRGGQKGINLYVVRLCLFKWNCDRLMYNFVKEMILKEFSYVT
jgi:hypothetical protein